MSAEQRSLTIQLNPEIIAMLQFSAKSHRLTTETYAERCIVDFLSASDRLYAAVGRIEGMEKTLIEIAGFVGEIRAAVDVVGRNMIKGAPDSQKSRATTPGTRSTRK